MFSDPATFRTAEPFPHVVIDDLWDAARLRAIAAEFPPATDPRWVTYPDPKERGKRCGGPDMWGPETHRWFSDMRTPEMARELETLTGIQSLSADTLGGGMHMTSDGGRLASHVDFNIHPHDPTRERRVNVLVFLNPLWRNEWGGALVLGEHRDVEITPTFNRTVIFETSDRSWHGHPDPIAGEHHRKSLACYFYAPRRTEASNPHSTIWR
ncbi:2OG-Fe(II) oxygenase superfamily protein [Amycolatopsis pretoriensis]|uniref:2OG-Fe(II) oxygenase superfamily protein n=1 Tax=Amycolatopsis pretoriensis TaxID=218821 RepID=A0A1H5R7U7_9PSEU|nr:2OG-Fe(II) oxygenase [Amycolatopsis pretoriensis]SEF34389.1 2OG-Fe(II) oxygenase superfamily protein [Amycolatopsis pretoriensis]